MFDGKAIAIDMKSIQQLMKLTGKCAVISGGAGHLGRAFGDTLGELGADIVLVDIDEARLELSAKELKAKWGGSVVSIDCDLESESDRNKLITTLNKLDSIDILVNNAAFVGSSNLEGWVVPFEEQTVETWRRAIEVNLTAVFHLSQGLAGKLAENKRGSIINISSIYGVVGPDNRIYEGTSMGNAAAYAASKGGVVQLSRWLSTVLAPDVRVNCVSPGGIERGQPAAFKRRYVDKTPLDRMGREEDMRGALAYLATNLSDYVTGQNIIVDGGWTSW
jgi:NAD(P)-dependent dehydrogenase (short-subunit alcohol dehydrogenase family)